MHILFEQFVLPSKDLQVGARLSVDSDLAVEDSVVHRNFTNAELNDSFSGFLDDLHGQRACECSGDYKKK